MTCKWRLKTTQNNQNNQNINLFFIISQINDSNLPIKKKKKIQILNISMQVLVENEMTYLPFFKNKNKLSYQNS